MDNASPVAGGKKQKKKFRNSIKERLEAAFGDLKNGVGEKRFKAAVKRAGKLLAGDLFAKAKKDKKKKKKKQKAETEPAEGLVM
jgi:hypothetical protein